MNMIEQKSIPEQKIHVSFTNESETAIHLEVVRTGEYFEIHKILSDDGYRTIVLDGDALIVKNRKGGEILRLDLLQTVEL